MTKQANELDEAAFNKELFWKFVQYTKEALDEILLPTNKMEDYVRLFHRIKGDASIFNITEVMSICQTCESHLNKLTDKDLDSNLLAKIKGYRNSVELELQKFIDENKSADKF